MFRFRKKAAIHRDDKADDKTLVDRDDAVDAFIDHCRSEAKKLEASLPAVLSSYCTVRMDDPPLTR